MRERSGTDDIELPASPAEFENAVSPQVKHAPVVAAADQRRVPLEAESRLAFRGFRLPGAPFSGARIKAKYFPALRLRVDDIPVVRIKHAVEAVPAANVGPVGIPDSFLGVSATWPDPVAVVLEAAGDPVRRALIHIDAVELAQRGAG